jgi:UDP:flavonoid glycosyltransferase YjiC (YdhE family)
VAQARPALQGRRARAAGHHGDRARARRGGHDVARVLVVTWAPGGNLPPLLAAAALLAARGHDVEILGSGAVAHATRSYRRAPDPETTIAFERQARAMLATAAGMPVALDVRDALLETEPDLAVVDCMLPAGLAAAGATGTPAASLVHFLYGPARRQLLRGGAWTTDLATLAETHRALGRPAAPDGRAAWETPELLLVAAPRWLDEDVAFPDHVVHAGPLGVRRPGGVRRERVLLSFSTTVMEGQIAAIQRVLDGVAMDALLTLGPAIEQGALRPPPNVEVVAFADHDDVLPTCAAVVTHGGLGTVLRALAHGVPQLLLPLGRDQHVNAARVARLGAGLVVEPDGDVRASLEALLGEPSFAAAAARAAARIAADAPDRRAADALERAARAP